MRFAQIGCLVYVDPNDGEGRPAAGVVVEGSLETLLEVCTALLKGNFSRFDMRERVEAFGRMKEGGCTDAVAGGIAKDADARNDIQGVATFVTEMKESAVAVWVRRFGIGLVVGGGGRPEGIEAIDEGVGEEFD